MNAPLTPGRIGRPGNSRAKHYHMTDDWHDRQVAYLRTVEDEDRRHRYLRGIEMVLGEPIRAAVEADVERLGPCGVIRRPDRSNGHCGRRAA